MENGIQIIYLQPAPNILSGSLKVCSIDKVLTTAIK